MFSFNRTRFRARKYLLLFLYLFYFIFGEGAGLVKSRAPAERAWVTRRAGAKKIQNGLTILDCTVKCEEECSEGAFLGEYVRILNRQRKVGHLKPVGFCLKHVRCSTRGKHSLQDYLKRAHTSTIHVSAHGNVDKKTGVTYLLAGNGTFTLKHLKDIWSDREAADRPLLVVLSACNAGHKDFIRALSDEGCRYCIAPVLEPDWHSAALFSSLFYTYLLLGEVNGQPPKAHPLEVVYAFRKAKDRLPDLTGYWKLYEYGEEKE